MTIWSLWRKRNTQIWEDKVETVLQIIGRANHTLHVWQHAQSTAANRSASSNLPTSVATLMQLFSCRRMQFAMGACLRDKVAGFVAAFSCHDSGTFTATSAEAWG
ncbi:hypothetical protein L195_g044069 [Trifolium pratense]|uniref:Uncharacterized protein n=1 Tax=Trifolium pratense TaxID=57577 RepID=A0A2K3MB16_TRIPR|nr:hypothetical protein L195_g044069 [Trifolium pratense]